MTIKECKSGRDCAKENEVDCCRTCLCKKPKSLDEINTECIFVEKVFDARLFKNEFQVRVGFGLNITPAIESIKTIKVDCKVLSVTTAISEVSINGFGIDTDTAIPGPGGQQIVLNQEEIKNIVNTQICAEAGKGSKVQLNQRIRVDYTVEITVSGTGINSNGQLVDYIGSITSGLAIEPVLGDKMCIPSLSLFPISMITSCLAECTYALINFTLNTPTNISIFGSTIFCNICETKLKVPTQICVLTSGPCRIKKDPGLCNQGNFEEISLDFENDFEENPRELPLDFKEDN